MNEYVYIGAGVLMIAFLVSIGLFFLNERKGDVRMWHVLALLGMAVAVLIMIENYASLYDYIYVGLMWLDPFIGVWVYSILVITAVFTANFFTSGYGWQ